MIRVYTTRNSSMGKPNTSVAISSIDLSYTYGSRRIKPAMRMITAITCNAARMVTPRGRILFPSIIWRLCSSCGKVNFPIKPQFGHVRRRFSPGFPSAVSMWLHAGQLIFFIILLINMVWFFYVFGISQPPLLVLHISECFSSAIFTVLSLTYIVLLLTYNLYILRRRLKVRRRTRVGKSIPFVSLMPPLVYHPPRPMPPLSCHPFSQHKKR